MIYVVKNDVGKKAEYIELVKKCNANQTTDTSNLVKKKLILIVKLVKLKKKKYYWSW